MSGRGGFAGFGRAGSAMCAAMLVAAVLAGPGAIAAGAATTGSISGTVTAAAGAAPLAGICVIAHQTDVDATFITSTATAADGTYTLTSVPAGSANVQFSDTGFCPGGVTGNFVGQWNNNQPSLDTANPVTVTSGATTAGVNAALVAGGAISGTVTAAVGGAPLNTICVGAYLPGSDPLLVASTSTAADGTYTLTGVPPTNVLVEFTATGFCPGGVAANFEGQWYNGKLTPDVADAVSVTAGATHSGINAALNASGSFSGTVTAAVGGTPLQGICVAAYLPFVSGVAPQLITSTSTAANGTYTLPGAPVGNIDVKFYATSFCPGGIASGFGMQWYNNQPLQETANTVAITAGATTPNINAALVAGGAISGRVTSAATSAGLSGICVAAFSTGSAPVVVASTGTSGDGSYSLGGIPAGTVNVRFNSQGFCPGGIFQHFATQWFNNKPDPTTADVVTVAAGATTANINAAMAPPVATSFAIQVNGGATASIAAGAQATLSETGLPATYGTVVFSSAGQPNLCTITFPGTSTVCQTPAGLAGGTYSPITATFTDADGAFTSSSSTNSVALTIGTATLNPTAFTIAVNAGASASVLPGTQATLSEAALPGPPASGSVVFGSPGHANLCTITLPATSCQTSAGLAVGSYTPISAVFTDTDGKYAGSTSTNTVSLTVSTTPPPFMIAVNGQPVSAISFGDTAILSESGLPSTSVGSIVFGSVGQPNLCTLTFPSTTCHTSASLAIGGYTPITASLIDSKGHFTGQTSTNTLTLTVNPVATSFTIAINDTSAATIAHGKSATLSESGLPAFATGTVTFGTLQQPGICTLVLPSTTCPTTALPAGTYTPISAVFTPGDALYAGSTATNSVTLRVVSPPAKPAAPRQVHATSANPGKATVTWTAPAANGGARITGYIVTFGGKSIWFGGKSHWVPASTKKLTFGTLGKGNYHFKVRAINQSGAGAWSAPTALITVA